MKQKKHGVFLLSIGDELLDGRTVNTNASVFGNELASVGIPVAEVRAISDSLETIVETLRDAAKYPIVIVTGGLGPTNDDRTAEGAALAFSRPLRTSKESIHHVKSRYAARGRPVDKARLRQAYLPERAKLLANATGIAPGFYLKIQDSEFFFFPGVPGECHPMFRQFALPRAQKRAATKKLWRRELWRSFGLAEGDLNQSIAALLKPFEKKYPQSFQVGVHIDFPGVDLTLEVWDIPGTPKPSSAELDRLCQKISARLGSHIYSRERGQTLADVVLRLLQKRGQTLATAESCTGGALGKVLTDIPGSSAMYWGGAISYANDAKEKLLGVKAASLRRYGAVSKEVAFEMAEQIRLLAATDFSLSVTGISGPGGGTATKPVGTFYVGLANKHGTITLHRVPKSQFWSRKWNRTFAVHFALDMLRQQLLR